MIQAVAEQGAIGQPGHGVVQGQVLGVRLAGGQATGHLPRAKRHPGAGAQGEEREDPEDRRQRADDLPGRRLRGPFQAEASRRAVEGDRRHQLLRRGGADADQGEIRQLPDVGVLGDVVVEVDDADHGGPVVRPAQGDGQFGLVGEDVHRGGGRQALGVGRGPGQLPQGGFGGMKRGVGRDGTGVDSFAESDQPALGVDGQRPSTLFRDGRLGWIGLRKQLVAAGKEGGGLAGQARGQHRTLRTTRDGVGAHAEHDRRYVHGRQGQKSNDRQGDDQAIAHRGRSGRRLLHDVSHPVLGRIVKTG